jgi:hypothetical protein
MFIFEAKMFAKMKMFAKFIIFAKKWRKPFFKTLLSVLLWPQFFLQKYVTTARYGNVVSRRYNMNETTKSF